MSAIEHRLSRRALVAGGAGLAGAAGLAGTLATLPAHGQTRSPTMNTTIRVDDGITTLVNVFSVEPEGQAKVLALLQDGTENIFVTLPGWISTTLHKSRDGRRIVVYSQWRDAASIEAFRGDPRIKPYLAQFGELAKSEAFTCDVSYSRHV
jgi:quinol monooxygenase YgiN